MPSVARSKFHKFVRFRVLVIGLQIYYKEAKLGNTFQTLFLFGPSLRGKCQYSEFFWSIFCRIRTESGEIWSISPYSVRMQENTDQKNSKYGPFLRSAFKPLTTDIHKNFIHT